MLGKKKKRKNSNLAMEDEPEPPKKKKKSEQTLLVLKKNINMGMGTSNPIENVSFCFPSCCSLVLTLGLMTKLYEVIIALTNF